MPALNKTRIPNPNSTIALTAGDHHVAVLEPDEAAVHGAARQDNAALAFAAVTVPAEDVLANTQDDEAFGFRRAWQLALEGGRQSGAFAGSLPQRRWKE